MIRSLSIALAATLLVLPVYAAEKPREGDHLYRVTTLRAAPGQFQQLLNWHERLAASGYYEAAGLDAPILMRHSQGDQWDLMTIMAMGDWQAFHSEPMREKRTEAALRHERLLAERSALLAFEEDVFAFGPPADVIAEEYAASGLFHIEMFAALPGKADELLDQRRMENDYLAATGQVTNLIFRRAAGSDVDVFTIGFHRSLESFASPAPASDAEKETAARAAGFKDRADLSFYLRSLLAEHHDTLAVAVR